jgi:hypothetical protein
VTWSLDGSTLFVDPESPAHWFVRVRIPDGGIERIVDVADDVRHYGAGVALDGRPLFLRYPTDIYALQLERK